MISDIKTSNGKAVVVDENGRTRCSRCLMENETVTGYTSTTWTTKDKDGRVRIFDEDGALKCAYWS